MAFGAFMAVFRTLDHHFVFQQFRSETIKRQIQENLGATINQITNRNLESFRIPWPRERLERKTIAAALTDVDELIDALDNLTAKKRDLKQAVMQQLLTGRTRLPGFSEEWEVKRLGDVLARMANGAVYKPTTSFGLPITRIETISDGVIDFSRVGYTAMDPELNKYRIEPGDILFSHINSLDHIGKAAFFEDERQLYHGMNLLLLRTNEKNNSRFVYFWLTSEMGRKQTRILAKQAVNQASINTAELKKVEILFPPVPEQVAIATVLSDLDAEILAIEQRRDKIRSLKLGMTQELLTGKTRLI
jgi:type I restriction enzyme S subunit